ncbi:MAG: hypothetical protein QXJ17_07630 [Nitrososphaeria archaeon]
MSIKVDMKNILKDMVGEEYDLSKKLKELAEEINSSVIKSLLMVIALDSEKHSNLYSTVIDLLDVSRRMVPESDIERIESEVDYHIRNEARHFDEVKKIMDSTEDFRIKFLLELILEDEAKHHRIFKELKNAIMSKEALTEDIVWDMVWKDAVFHGGPGG